MINTPGYRHAREANACVIETGERAALALFTETADARVGNAARMRSVWERAYLDALAPYCTCGGVGYAQHVSMCDVFLYVSVRT